MFGLHVDAQNKGTVRVFESFDEGLAWIRSLDAPPVSGFAAEDEPGVIDPV